MHTPNEPVPNPPDSDRMRLIKDLVSRAIALPRAERAAFIAGGARADALLALEVSELVAAYDAAGSFMGSPTQASQAAPEAVAAATQPPTANRGATSAGGIQGTRIGPYKILEPIGEGGFGSVFLAQQREPVQRKVALKVIKPGMDSRMVAARFEAERQALALMDHPHIARVFDGGVTDAATGSRPYFVMEYVKGDPITEFADAHKLSLTDRLHLFTQVCQAVQHAHTKGVIHRDLKPSNVLVSMTDGKPFARVIDFGIAKATGARLTDRTLFTEHRQLIGTPEYMSPEQAEGSPDIDTRTDVYGLGVLLYELLTGATPFDAARLRSAAFAEMQRIIREEEPPLPSVRLSRDLKALAATALARQSEAGKLGTLIKGELDWIVMKCLEKDRARRYGTATGVADDVQRHLSGEPITAALPSMAYRMRKFAHRHRGPVLAASLVAAALLIGTLGTAWGLVLSIDRAQKAQAASLLAEEQSVKAEEAARRALTEAARARSAESAAEHARMEAQRQRDEVTARAYAANISGAQAALDKGNVAIARSRLEDCAPDLRGWEWRHLNALSDMSLAQVAFPGAREVSATPTLDGSAVLVGTDSGQLRLLRAADWSELRRIDVPMKWRILDGNPPRVRLSPNGARVLAGMNGLSAEMGAQGPWLLLDSSTLDTVCTLGADAGLHAAWRFSPDSELAACVDRDGNSLSVHQAADGSLVARHALPVGDVSVMLFSPDSSTLLVGLTTGEILLWSRSTDRLTTVLELRRPGYLHTTMSPDTSTAATVFDDGTIAFWSPFPFRLAGTVALPDFNKSSLYFEGLFAWSPDSQRFAATALTSVVVWDVSSRVLYATCPTHWRTGRHHISFSPDGALLLLRDYQGEAAWPDLYVWDVRSGHALLRASDPDLGGYSAAIFLPDSQTLLAGTVKGQIRRWTLAGGEMRYTGDWYGHAAGISQLANLADRRELLSCGVDGSMRVWDADGPSNPVLCDTVQAYYAYLSADGERVLGASRAPSAGRAWDSRTGRTVLDYGTLEGPHGDDGYRPQFLAISSARDRMMFDCGDHSLVLDADTGHVVKRLGWGSLNATKLCMNSDFSALAVYTRSGGARVHLVETATGQTRWSAPVAEYEEDETTGHMAFSSDGKFVACAADSEHVGLWSTATGQLLHRYLAEEPSGVLTFSPDGLTLAVGYRGGSIRLWSTVDYRLVYHLRGHSRQVICLTYSADGLRLPAATDATVVLWDPQRGTDVFTLPCLLPSQVDFSPDGQKLMIMEGGLKSLVYDAAHAEARATRATEHTIAEGARIAQAALRAAGDRMAQAAASVRQQQLEPLLRRAALDELARIQMFRGQRVREMRDRLWIAQDVVRAVQAQPGTSEGERADLIREAESLGDITAFQLNGRSWSIVKEPNASLEQYTVAARAAARAVSLTPDDGYIVNTLGVAQYRLGNWAEAITTLRRSDQLNTDEYGRRFIADVAFIAMAQYRLGLIDDAHRTLEDLRQLAHSGDEDRAFLDEAESLIAGRPVPAPPSDGPPR